ncbi:hypothetical protein BH18ACI2_BH18ACI2_13290 [soil metagenome]
MHTKEHEYVKAKLGSDAPFTDGMGIDIFPSCQFVFIRG